MIDQLVRCIKMSSKKRRYYCEHCDENVSERTYKRHRAEFFDPKAKEWRKQRMRRIDLPTLQADSDAEDDKIITGW